MQVAGRAVFKAGWRGKKAPYETAKLEIALIEA